MLRKEAPMRVRVMPVLYAKSHQKSYAKMGLKEFPLEYSLSCPVVAYRVLRRPSAFIVSAVAK